MASKTVIRPIRPRFRRRPNLQSGNPCQLSVLVFTRKNLHDMKWYFKVHERHVNTISVLSSQLFSTNSAWRTHFVLEIWKTKSILCLRTKIVFFCATHFTWLSRLCHARCLPHGTHANETTDVRAFFSSCQWGRHRNKSLALSAIFHFPSFGTCETYSSLLTLVYSAGCLQRLSTKPMENRYLQSAFKTLAT